MIGCDCIKTTALNKTDENSIDLGTSIVFRDKIAYIIQDEFRKVRVQFVGVEKQLTLEGVEAMELWKEFSDKGWQNDA